MDYLSINQVTEMMQNVSGRIIQSEKYLTELDTIIGDGDHGFGMRKGFEAVQKQLASESYEDVFQLFKDVGMTLIKVMGGTSGVIFGTLFIDGLKVLECKKTLTLKDFSEYFDQGTKAIARRGRTKRGDKTMYDALVEGTEALVVSANNSESFYEAMQKASNAAMKGMENTKNMVSHKGRSKNFGEMTFGHPDSGAVSVTIIFEAMLESIRSFEHA